MLSKPNPARNLVVVLPGDLAGAIKSGNYYLLDPINFEKSEGVAKSVLRFVAGDFVAAIPDVIATSNRAVNRIRKYSYGGLDVRIISRTESAGLKFPPGHPIDEVLYAGHPALNDVYFTLPSFHKMLFEHKFAEAVDILMHLGATEIKAEFVRGWSDQVAGNLSVAVPAKEIGAKFKSSKAHGANMVFEAKFEGSGSPSLPEGLVWYPHESTWQTVAKGRMSFGMKEFSLAVNYEDDFGVNADLKATAMNVGLDVGGEMEDHEATTWKLHGKFGDPAAAAAAQ